jgi:hypothetical protein
MHLVPPTSRGDSTVDSGPLQVFSTHQHTLRVPLCQMRCSWRQIKKRTGSTTTFDSRNYHCRVCLANPTRGSFGRTRIFFRQRATAVRHVLLVHPRLCAQDVVVSRARPRAPMDTNTTQSHEAPRLRRQRRAPVAFWTGQQSGTYVHGQFTMT